MRARVLWIVGVVVLLAGTAFAQSPTPTPAPKPAAAPTPTPAPGANTEPPRPPETYVYNSEGRRDPFLNLLGTGAAESRTPSKRADGAAGLMVEEISVRGIMEGKAGLVAMVQGPDSKTYIVHQGDRFLDGRIKTITPQGLIIIQEVNDPLSLVKEREIRKLLRSLEDAKG